MTSKEYVIWLRGFVEACHEYAPTPKQWDALKDKLAEVTDESSPSFPFGTPNTAPVDPFPKWQQPHYPNPFDKPFIDPYNPYKITCSSGSFGTITTTPGTGYITTYNPIQFGSGSMYSTSTTYGYPSGSAWSYTNSKPHNED
jgi:hypothetical protein